MTAVKDMRPDLLTGADLLKAFDAVGHDKLAAALPSLKDRAQTLAEMATGALYLIVQRPLPLDAKAKALIDTEAKVALASLIEKFRTANDWTATALEAVVREHAEETGAKLGKLAQPLRAALSGRSVSPPVFDVMVVLGRDETLARLRDHV
jgi:glutamyl-tRNA synthetase